MEEEEEVVPKKPTQIPLSSLNSLLHRWWYGVDCSVVQEVIKSYRIAPRQIFPNGRPKEGLSRFVTIPLAISNVFFIFRPR